VIGLILVILSVLLGAELRSVRDERNAALTERDEAVAQVEWCGAIEQATLRLARAGLATDEFLVGYCAEDVGSHQEKVCGRYVQFLKERLEKGVYNYQTPDLLPPWLASKVNTILSGAVTSDQMLVESREDNNEALWKSTAMVKGALPTMLTNLVNLPLSQNEPGAILTPAPTPRPLSTMGPAKPRQEVQEVAFVP
jgi:hypothetical protein